MEHFSKEKTLVMVKPDGIQRTLVGEIIKRYERVGLKLVGLKMIAPSKEKIEEHYTLDPEWRRITGEKTIESYKKNMTSGPVIAMVWQGAHAVKISRKIVGGTEPFTSDVGTIRGDFVLDSYQMSDADGRAVRNLIHASGSVEEAEKEIKHWFEESEIISYRLVQEQMLYDVNIDGIFE